MYIVAICEKWFSPLFKLGKVMVLSCTPSLHKVVVFSLNCLGKINDSYKANT